MSTIPRVSSAIAGEPATLRSALAHCPDLAAAFHRLYGTMWSQGVLSQAIKDTMAERRAARAARAQLEREIGAYSSASDLLELEAIIARYPEEQTVEVREVLTQQVMNRLAA